MKVITVIDNENNPKFNLLRLSCALNRLKLIVLVSKSNFYSKRLKDDLLKDYLLDENEDDIILFTDGTDAIFTALEEEILMKFRNFNTDLVFSTEIGCWPDNKLAKFYEIDKKTPYNYLNSGGFIGKVGLIKEFLDDDLSTYDEFTWSNQYLWVKRYLKNTNKIKLDKYCEIFCTLYTEDGEKYYRSNFNKFYELKRKWFNDNILFENNRFYNKITKTWPCHAHFNGSAKWFFDNKIEQMVYTAIPGYKKAELYYEK